MIKKVLGLIFSLLLLASFVQAQTAQVTVSFNEQFFDALLDAIFKNLKQPDFPLAAKNPKTNVLSAKSLASSFQNNELTIQNPKSKI